MIMRRFDFIEENVDTVLWNSKALHPVQTWEWGNARQRTGTKVLRIGVYEEDQFTHGYQITLHKIPVIGKYVAYLAMSDFPDSETLDSLKLLLKEYDVVHITIEANQLASSFDQIILKRNDLQPSKEHHFYRDTLVLNLIPDEEKLLSDMKQKTRYNIRLAAKKGVVVRRAETDGDFEDYLDLYFETVQRQHYFGRTRGYQKIVWEEMRKNLATILIAYYNGIPLAAFELFYLNGVMYYCFGGSTQEFKNVMAPNLLMWESIKYAKQLGAQSFDMWGATPPHKAEKEWGGFTRFKEGYGGEYIELVPSYDLVLQPSAYYLFLLAQKAKKMHIKMKKVIKR
jgi:lipid II:glycine glycyltransferase (peptidoglycan interpeptide bridge formation enzyme)